MNRMEGAQRMWLLGILALSLLLNVWGIGWGVPERWHPDEVTQRAENMVGTPTLNPHFFVYGGLHHYFIAALAVLPVKVPNKFLCLMGYAAQSTLVVILSRLLSALLGTGVVFLTFLIGQELFDPRAGLFAAALLATSMLLVNLSHFATVDVPSLFWFTLSCVLAIRVFRGGSGRSYLLAGLCSGVAAAVKYVGGLAFIVLIAAHFLGGSKTHRLLVGALLMGAVGFILGNPVLLFAPFEFAEGFVAEMVFASARGLGLSRAFLPLIFQLKEAMGVPLFLLSLAGLVHGVRLLASRKNRASILLALSMMLPYYFVVGSMRGPRAGPLLGPLPPLRYTLPIMPFLLLLAGKMLSDLVDARRRYTAHVARAGFAVALSYSIAYSASADLKFTYDSRYAARAWLLDNVQPGAVVETTSYGPTVPRDKYVVVERPHDNQVADVAASVGTSALRLQTMVEDLEGWLTRAGLRTRNEHYVSWYEKALLHYEEETSTFDVGTQGLESRAPDVLVVSDLYAGRFRDRSSAEGAFFSDLSSGRTSYRKIAEFHYELPSWLDPPAEFVDPKIAVYSQKLTGRN